MEAQWSNGRARDPRNVWTSARGSAAVFVLAALSATALGQNEILAWGANATGACNVPAPPWGRTWVRVAAGDEASLGLLDDGTILGWGWCGAGQCAPPALPPGVSHVDVAMAHAYGLALRSDGEVVAWGGNDQGQTLVPALPPGLAYVEIGAGWNFAMARRSDGSVVAWGGNAFGERNVPALPPGLAYVQISAGVRQGVAVCTDGSLVSWGVLPPAPALPPGLTCVEARAGNDFALARLSDGSVIAWGDDTYGQCNVPPLPSGVVYAEIAAGWWVSAARRSDGVVVVWGNNASGQCTVPPLPPGLAASRLAVGNFHVLALLEPGVACGSITPYCWPPEKNSFDARGARIAMAGSASVSANDLVLAVSGLPPGGLGQFFCGRDTAYFANGGGHTCVTGVLARIRPKLYANAAGTVGLALDLSGPLGTSLLAMVPGSTWNFQYWYRDLGTGPGAYNFSDAEHVVFAP
ncbi:MAG: hypothetical protein HZA53_15370 [Planctomycetes bacterium]|nr:hypothetical protein [Planctomycetota bacterium]